MKTKTKIPTLALFALFAIVFSSYGMGLPRKEVVFFIGRNPDEDEPFVFKENDVCEICQVYSVPPCGNSSKVLIGKKWLTRGQRFNANEIVYLKKNQAVSIWVPRAKNYYKLSLDLLEKTPQRSIYGFGIKIRELAGKGDGSLAGILELCRWPMVGDSLVIPVDNRIFDDDHFFRFTAITPEDTISFGLKGDNERQTLTIMKDSLKSSGIDLTKLDSYRFKVEYLVVANDTIIDKTVITDNFRIEYFPNN